MASAEISEVKSSSESVGGSKRQTAALLHKLKDNEDENCNENEVLENSSSTTKKCLAENCESIVMNGNSLEKEDSKPIITKMEDINDKDEKPILPAGAGDIENQIINCTACGQQINHKSFSFEKHPVLEVIMCKKCISYYNSGNFSQDVNGLDEYCRWCAEGGKLICCDFCHNAFCKECIRRNFGRKELSHVMNSDKWSCYVCDSKPLIELKSICNVLLNQQKSRTRKKKKLQFDETNHSGKGNMIKELSKKGDNDENWLENSLKKTLLAVRMLKSSAESLHSLFKKKPRDFQNNLMVSRKLLKALNSTKHNIDVITSEVSCGLETSKDENQISGNKFKLKDNTEINSNDYVGCNGSNSSNNLVKHCPNSFESTKQTEKQHCKLDKKLDNDKQVYRKSSNKSLSEYIKEKQHEDCNDSFNDKEQKSETVNQNKRNKGNLKLGLSSVKDKKKASSNLSLKKKLNTEKLKVMSKKMPVKDISEISEETATKCNKEQPKIKREIMDEVQNGSDDDFSVNEVFQTEATEKVDNCFNQENINETEKKERKGRIKVQSDSSFTENSIDESINNTSKLPRNVVKIKQEILEDDLKENIKEKKEMDLESLKLSTENDTKTNIQVHIKKEVMDIVETVQDQNFPIVAMERTPTKSTINQHKIKTEVLSDEEQSTNNNTVNDDKIYRNANEIAKQKLLAELINDDDSDSDDKFCSQSGRPRRKVTPKKGKKEQEVSDEENSSDSLFSSSDESESDSEAVVKRFKTQKSECDNDDKLNMEVKIKLTRIEPLNKNSNSENNDEELSEYQNKKNISKKRNSASSESDIEKEVNKLCDLKSLKARKRKRSSSLSEKETDEEVDNKKSEGSSSKLKSKKKKKDKKTLLNMSSASEGSADDDNDDVPMESDDEVPSKKEIKIKNEDKSLNEVSKDLLKEELLKSSSSEDSHSDTERKPKLGEVALFDDDDEFEAVSNEEEKDTKQTNRKEESLEDGKNSAEENKEESSEDDESKSKKKSRHPLLKVKLSESESDEEEETAVKKKKKIASKDKSAKGRRRKTYITDSEEEVEFASSEEEEEENASDSNKSVSSGAGRKTRRSKKAEEEKKANKKRRRIKELKGSSSETEGNSGDEKKKGDKDDKGDTPGKGRKNIRKLMKDSNLKEETKAAAREEEERRQRVAERQKLYNEVQTGGTGEFGCPIVTKLVLDKNLETEEELVAIHTDLITKLKPHQVQGVQFMWNAVCESIEQMQKHPGSGCILAHCMGLGKTLQVITFVHTVLSNSRTNLNTCLVVCPLNTILNWANEFSVWLDTDELSLNVFEMSGAKTNNKRAEMLSIWKEEGGVLIMGYDMFRNLVQEKGKRGSKRQKEVFKSALIDPGADIVVCDEGHILKNDNTALAKAMNRIATRRRIVLTGTPLQNNLSEYHCMVQFVKPSLLGTRKEFQNRFMNPINNGQCADSTPHDFRLMKRRAHILHNLLDGCVQRRDYNVLTPFLPPKFEYVISIRLSEIQTKLYQHFLENFTRGKMSGCKGSGLFADYQALMKIWTHPYVLKLAEIRDENKAQYDSEDSFIDDESIASTTSEDSSDVKLDEPSSSKGRRGKKSSGDEVSGDEVINNWRTRRRGGTDEPLIPENVVKEASKEWWTEFISEEAASKIELGGKLVLLLDILQECEAIGDKVLVFSQSLLSLDLIEEMLQRSDEFDSNKPKITTTNGDYIGSWTRGLDYFRMDGSTGADLRKRCTESFNNDDNNRARLFLISTRAGGLGINLVSANRVIIFDASWNPTHDVQSIFRVYRFGQKKPVYVYRFVAQGTMEEKIYDRQITKLSLACRVVDEQQIERHFNAADLQELYMFNPETNSKKLTPIVPKDRLLAELLQRQKEWISGYHEQDSLLENKQEEELSEEERKAAWAEYEAEKKGLISATGIGILFPTGGAIDINTIIEKIQEQWPGLNQEELNGKVSDVIVWLRQQQQQQQMQAYQQRQLYQQTLYQQQQQQYQQQQYQLQQQQYQQQQMQPYQQLQQQQDRLRQHHLSLLRSPNQWRGGSLPTAGLPSQSAITNMYLDSNNSANPSMPSQGSLVPETPLISQTNLSPTSSAVLPSPEISNKDSSPKLL